MRWRGVLAKTLRPWCPPAVWQQLNRVNSSSATESGVIAPVNAECRAELDRAVRARAHALEFSGRPATNAFEARMRSLRRSDQGTTNKGILGGWRIDQRCPTACLAIPTEQFLSNGTQRALARRALADRLPRVVLEERRRGMTGADWHERLTTVREHIAAELDRLSECPAAARTIDLPRMRALVDNWPSGGWEHPHVERPYRGALLLAISAGHFLRRATGGNY
jgi:asparagine synthase (glutamine-hydrolysing)